jgi:hypothetical protein
MGPMAVLAPQVVRRARRAREVALLPALLLPALLLLPARARAEDEVLQREPPWVFFTTPEEDAAVAIDRILETTFADLNLVVDSREKLVRRYGVWSVPRLARELASANHDSGVLNAALTAAALRAHLGPAPELAPLVRPLVSTARSVEEWRRVAAMIALATFQGPEGVGREPRPDKLIPNHPVAEARKLLGDDALDALRSGLRDQSVAVRCVAALALGKIGGPVAGSMLRQEVPLDDAAPPPRVSALLARGFLAHGGANDGELFIEALGDSERNVRAGAALGAALQVICDLPPAWTDAPGRMLRALLTAAVNTGKQDTAEALFCRGCLAWKGQDARLWQEVLAVATSADVEDPVAEACAQVLVWCDDPAVRSHALGQITGNFKALKPPVLASLLLKAASDGTREGMTAIAPWLANAGYAPRAQPDWDVRWHIVVGLLRALAAGRFADESVRASAIAALEQVARRGLDREAPLLPALERLLATHGPALTNRPAARLPEEVLRDIEAVCRCRYGILAPDLRAAGVARANRMLFEVILDLSDLKSFAPQRVKEKDKEGSARRFLQGYFLKWPFFARQDLQAGRGFRPAPRLSFDDPAKVLDRGPR